ncbi:MAG TPA: hypothetical protein VI322_04560 [Candidatus Saccharimonadia bacterium]
MKRYLYLLVGLALLGAGWYVRSQNLAEAKRQAAAIVDQDKTGALSTSAEAELADYVKTHTGATVSYTLQGAYDRDLAAAKAAVAAASAANSQIYADAQKACAGKTDSITQAKCNQDYLAKHLKATPTANISEPAIASYQRKLTGPWWAPDLAGALLLGGVIAGALGLWQIRPVTKQRR